MRFSPHTENEGEKKFIPLEPGRCSFTVISQEDHYTKEGKVSLKLNLALVDARGNKGRIYEFFFSDSDKRIKALLNAVGRPDLLGHDGHLNPENLIDCRGLCVIEIKPNTEYRRVAQFLPHPASAQKAVLNDFSDEIPF